MPTVTKTAIINARVLHALSLASSTEEARYYLKGVCVVIEPHKVTYVATDGHVLAAYQEPADPPNTLCGTYIIPADTCKAVKPKGRSLPYMVLSFVGGKKYMLDGHTSAIFEPIDGTFPDWRRVIPSTVSGELAHFDPSLLARMQDCGVLINDLRKGSNAASIPRIHHNGDGPAILSWGSGDARRLLGVVMPVRSPSDMDVLPDWYMEERGHAHTQEAAE